MRHRFAFFVMATAALLLAGTTSHSQQYNPLAIDEESEIRVVDTVVYDSSREREIPVRIYLPLDASPQPVVLFSHGLGGSRNGSSYLGEHWSRRGYVCVFLQHPGSDTSVWKDVPRGQRMRAMEDAASPGNFLLRVKDVGSVLDQLQRWNATAGHELYGRLDMARVGMSGHSFGAVTTQAVSGQSAFRQRISFVDGRIKAAIAFSPSSPRRADPSQAFASVKIPWMLMTGTLDSSPIGNSDVASRLAVFPALPPNGKYEVVLNEALHSAFTDSPLPGDRGTRNPNHHRVILALSTAFWDAWLRGNAEAKAWLDGDGPRSILEPADRWQTK